MNALYYVMFLRLRRKRFIHLRDDVYQSFLLCRWRSVEISHKDHLRSYIPQVRSSWRLRRIPLSPTEKIAMLS